MQPVDRTHIVNTLDLGFLGLTGVIASYLIPHAHGAVLVESGPGSTVAGLQRELARHGLSVGDISDVLLTHIHLDHAGAAGWLARQGARVHVHPVGAPHLLNPEKLLASAARIYGDQMQTLWGEFLNVPEERLHVVEDNEVLEIDGLRFQALSTPGHANHHHAYIFEGICFSGDVGGVRMAGTRHLRLPMVPPEFILESWRASLTRLSRAFSQFEVHSIAPTHFGIFPDPDWHLASLAQALDEIEAWIEANLPGNPPETVVQEQFMDWTRQRTLEAGIDPSLIELYEAANPSFMSVGGILRYYRKYRAPQVS